MAPTSLISRRISSLVRPSRFRVQGWDPPLIISQIVTLQSLHYLTFSLIILVFLKLKTGVGLNVEMILDHKLFSNRIATPLRLMGDRIEDGVIRSSGNELGYAITGCWILTQSIQTFYLYHLIRRPTHILDFALTTIFIHIVISTFYTSTFPLSLFYWTIVVLSTVLQVVAAEQLCVSREMREVFSLPTIRGEEGRETRMDLELGTKISHTKSNSVSRGNYLAVPNPEED